MLVRIALDLKCTLLNVKSCANRCDCVVLNVKVCSTIANLNLFQIRITRRCYSNIEHNLVPRLFPLVEERPWVTVSIPEPAILGKEREALG
jgi:hypothetical protein